MKKYDFLLDITLTLIAVIYILLRAVLAVVLSAVGFICFIPGMLFCLAMGGTRRLLGKSREEFYGKAVSELLSGKPSE